MKSGTKAYFNRVLNEINNIKALATTEEIESLNLLGLRPSERDKCIYGQMTGDCFSFRAQYLIEECCNTTTSFDSLSASKTDAKKPVFDRNNRNFSYLEHCIYNHRHNNDNIIAYLKGEIPCLGLTQ